MPTHIRPSFQYATGNCWLGRILAIWTENGLFSLEPFDSTEAFEIHLPHKLPAHHTLPADSARQEELDGILAAIEKPGVPMPALKLDLQGTPFQQSVWQAIRGIPPGQTRTYTQLASQLDNPRATRAVANACGANRLAFVVPCHRVIRSDGTPGGYRWGLARKRALLEREKSAARASEQDGFTES